MQEMQETQVQSLGGEDLPEKSMTTHSSILSWRIPWTEEPDGHDWSNRAHSFANLCPALQPHGLQHTRLPCPSLSSRIWHEFHVTESICYPTISSSIALFSSCPPSFSASESFPMSQLLASGGQNIGASSLPYTKHYAKFFHSPLSHCLSAVL